MFAYFAQTETTSGGGLGSLYFILLLGVAFYFLIIRPQRRRAAQQRELVESVGIGDRVRTVGGIRGTVEALDEDTALLRLAEGAIEIERRAIAARVSDPSEE